MSSQTEIQPYPYFYYVDRSQQEDNEPGLPLTPHHRIPNFLVKLFCIVSREDFSHIIKWLPHGRSWKIIDSVEFEATIIPAYFGHVSLSSFRRQVNGWGFKRMTKGRNKNSYYNEYFLRALPHLLKMAPRPGQMNTNSNRDHEPGLFEISEMCPVPQTLDRSNNCIASIEFIDKSIRELGPKGRVSLPCTSIATIADREESLTAKSADAVKTEIDIDDVAPEAKRRKSHGDMPNFRMSDSSVLAAPPARAGCSPPVSRQSIQSQPLPKTQFREHKSDSLLDLWAQHQERQKQVRLQMERDRKQMNLEGMFGPTNENFNYNSNNDIMRYLQRNANQRAPQIHPTMNMTPGIDHVRQSQGLTQSDPRNERAISFPPMQSVLPPRQRSNASLNANNSALLPLLNSLQSNSTSIPSRLNSSNTASTQSANDSHMQELIQQAINAGLIMGFNRSYQEHNRRK